MNKINNTFQGKQRAFLIFLIVFGFSNALANTVVSGDGSEKKLNVE